MKILIAVAIILIFLVIRETCMLKKEGYADQVMHAVAGGIAGPILNPALYSYDSPRYPLPPGMRARAVTEYEEQPHPTALWAMPPESPA